jgi:hypothetical protein
MTLPIDEKQHPVGVRLLLGKLPPSRICKRGRMSDVGGQCSRRTCGVVEKSLAHKKEEKRAERAHDIIANPSCYSPCWASHFTGPPWYVAPFQQRKDGPHSSGEGRGSPPRFHVVKRERRRRWWWETRERGTETDPALHLVTCDQRLLYFTLLHPHRSVNESLTLIS